MGPIDWRIEAQVAYVHEFGNCLAYGQKCNKCWQTNHCAKASQEIENNKLKIKLGTGQANLLSHSVFKEMVIKHTSLKNTENRLISYMVKKIARNMFAEIPNK